MAGMKAALVALAFTGSIGMTLLIIACVLHTAWYPMMVSLFYILAPLPTLIARGHQERYGNPNQSCMNFAIFITMGLVVSSFALPIVLARTEVVLIDSCILTLIGNIVIYLTFIGFFMTLYQDDASYSIW